MAIFFPAKTSLFLTKPHRSVRPTDFFPRNLNNSQQISTELNFPGKTAIGCGPSEGGTCRADLSRHSVIATAEALAKADQAISR
jgi:hypothetical protein